MEKLKLNIEVDGSSCIHWMIEWRVFLDRTSGAKATRHQGTASVVIWSETQRSQKMGEW